LDLDKTNPNLGPQISLAMLNLDDREDSKLSTGRNIGSDPKLQRKWSGVPFDSRSKTNTETNNQLGNCLDLQDGELWSRKISIDASVQNEGYKLERLGSFDVDGIHLRKRTASNFEQPMLMPKKDLKMGPEPLESDRAEDYSDEGQLFHVARRIFNGDQDITVEELSALKEKERIILSSIVCRKFGFKPR